MKNTHKKLANGVIAKIKRALKNPPKGIPALVPGDVFTPKQIQFASQKTAYLGITAINSIEDITNEEDTAFGLFIADAIINYLQGAN